MKTRNKYLNAVKKITNLKKTVASILLLSICSPVFATNLAPLIDDFSHSHNNSLSLPRQFLTDQVAGGKTQFENEIAQGIIKLHGEVIPPRGQPGWASTVLLLDPTGQPIDASGFEGVRMKIKLKEGTFSISANSTQVTNFDFHAAQIFATADGQYHDVKIPFSAMKRTWSPQTELDPTTINSLSIVAFGLQQTTFDAEIDEISFY